MSEPWSVPDRYNAAAQVVDRQVAEGHGGQAGDRGWGGPALALVVAAAGALAAFHYVQFFPVWRMRWDSLVHDRNAYYLNGLTLALDVKRSAAPHLLKNFLFSSLLRPPLHDVLVAGILLVAGPDRRLAVLPSLAGWVGTTVLGFLVARRMVPRAGNLAGLTAAAFILGSPAHQAYATDVMLDSLGACLSLLVLYLYLGVKQAPSSRAARRLAIGLTALFLLKYNYWFLAVIGLAAAEAWAWRRDLATRLPEVVRRVDWRRLVAAEFRRPLAWVLLLLLALIAWVALTGGTRVELWGVPISIRSPNNPAHLAYIILVMRAACWWRRTGRAWAAGLDPRVRQLVFWHGLPVALWFLLPKRLGAFFWYLGPTNRADFPPETGRTLVFYAKSFVQEYHPGLLGALLAVGLFVVGALAIRHLRPGSGGVLFFVLAAALLTVAHPNVQSRFLHTWVVAAWVVAGAGTAWLLGAPRGRRAGYARRAAGAAALAALAASYLPGLLPFRHAAVAGLEHLEGSTLDLADYYLPYLAASRRTALLATVPMDGFARSTFLERYQDPSRLEGSNKGFGLSLEENRRLFARWLRETEADTIVFVDVPAGSPLSINGREPYERIRDFLDSQSVFHMARHRSFPELGCTVSIWTRPWRTAAAPGATHAEAQAPSP